MDDKRRIRPVSPFRLFGAGGAVGFLLDVVSHTIDLYLRGIAPTFSNIYTYGSRTGHAAAWLVSGFILVAYGAFVAGRAVGAILRNAKKGSTSHRGDSVE